MQSPTVSVSFRTSAKNRKALDSVAKSYDRDRSYILNEAIENYLSLQKSHIAQIEAGRADIKAGRIVSDAKVKAMMAKVRKSLIQKLD
jgi:predicted transcriptional regulator